MGGYDFRAAVFQKCRRHVIQAVENAPIYIDPSPHTLIQGFFPDDIYEELLSRLPPQQAYDPFSYRKHARNDGTMTRFRFQLLSDPLARLDQRNRQFWLGIRDVMGCQELKRAVYHKLGCGLAFRYSTREERAADLPGFPEPSLLRETEGYRIAPHPDTRRKVVTMQVALPEDDTQRDLGTEFYRRSVNPLSLLREPRGFEIVKQAPFLPNHAYAFAVLNTLTWKSWHGRTTLQAQSGVRNTLQNLWYEKAEYGNPEVVAEHYALTAAA
jgi:hypothetical protein